MIKRFEGLRLQAYDDGTGRWTIGWGHAAASVRRGDRITVALAEGMLASDIAKAEDIVNKLDVGLQPREFDALVSLAFNCPSAFRSSTGLYRALDTGALNMVPAEIRKWRLAGGKVLPGLVKRRDAEARLFAEGVYP